MLDAVCYVVISYELCMSNTTQEMFLMMARFTHEHVRDHARIGMLITTSTYGDSLAVTVSTVINQLILGIKLVGINSYGRTNLSRLR